ncbi:MULTISPECIES: hypothetical protein [Actinomadura]|uniref:Sigma-70 family RNA polymerase sigma factor n=1 Tax=Actinomadura yumaensis TaxID=111807 RepID=A0ABW2CFK2_9ACTN|nr:hypothetical protein [Actinomadura sp. J1-007]MWK35669.1 hypothetical protein [Actinomadura sp. J1-007]
MLDVAETTFDLLTRGPAPLAVDGAVLGHGLPARRIALDELRAILLHPATSHEARDLVWKELIGRARREGASWVMGCVGIALPGLKAIVRDRLRRLDTEPDAGTSHVAGELLSAFYDALLRIDVERPKIAQRLLAQSAKAVERRYQARARVVPVDPSTLARLAPAAAPSNGDVDLLLEAAVRQDVITADEAEIIAATRLEGFAPAVLAEHLGTSYDALMKRRRRAEMRLVEAMRDNGLRDDFGYLMSKTGV